MKKILSLSIFLLSYFVSNGQGFDSTQIGKEYPYIFPLLGKKAYERGYKLPKPHGFMLNGLFNKQSIILENFSMAFTQEGEEPDFDLLQPLSDLIVFGPSTGKINTLNLRFDTWLLPFFAVSGYYGQVQGSQTITLTSPIPITSDTDIDGSYFGLNLLAVAPVGPVVLGLDYSWSWTTNVRLDKPVLVKVSGLRMIKNFKVKGKEDMYIGFWSGAQYQNLKSETSGKIPLAEALDLDSNKLNEIDQQWEDYKMTPEWNQLPPGEKLAKEAAYQAARGFLDLVSQSTVHYKFNKKLEYDWSVLLGGQWQINRTWQFRTEYSFFKSKKQLLLSLNYRFGI